MEYLNLIQVRQSVYATGMQASGDDWPRAGESDEKQTFQLHRNNPEAYQRGSSCGNRGCSADACFVAGP
ncbi:MAG: hypothetical protein ACE5KS_07155, partial [Woeseiaceae bacterium]